MEDIRVIQEQARILRDAIERVDALLCASEVILGAARGIREIPKDSGDSSNQDAP